VKAREALLLEQDNMSMFLREQRRNGGTGGPTADDGHVAFSMIYHASEPH
jgi:hypothetical protein